VSRLCELMHKLCFLHYRYNINQIIFLAMTDNYYINIYIFIILLLRIVNFIVTDKLEIIFNIIKNNSNSDDVVKYINYIKSEIFKTIICM
jgi:hypothetical protein